MSFYRLKKFFFLISSFPCVFSAPRLIPVYYSLVFGSRNPFRLPAFHLRAPSVISCGLPRMTPPPDVPCPAPCFCTLPVSNIPPCLVLLSHFSPRHRFLLFSYNLCAFSYFFPSLQPLSTFLMIHAPRYPTGRSNLPENYLFPPALFLFLLDGGSVSSAIVLRTPFNMPGFRCVDLFSPRQARICPWTDYLSLFLS